MRVTALAGGIGGARFLLGLRAYLAERRDRGDGEITVIGNTGDDIWVHGLRVCPDLDTVMYTLGDGIDTERGWGRQHETFHAKEELAAYGVEPGDADVVNGLFGVELEANPLAFAFGGPAAAGVVDEHVDGGVAGVSGAGFDKLLGFSLGESIQAHAPDVVPFVFGGAVAEQAEIAGANRLEVVLGAEPADGGVDGYAKCDLAVGVRGF